MAGPRRITVLGTRFTVRREGEAVTVAVIEGRVKVEEVGSGKPAPAQIITRGDIVVANGPATLLTATSVDRVAAATSWRDGMLTFDQQTLGEVAAEFNRYNRKQLHIEGPAAQIRIGGRFQAEDVEAFALLLRQAYGLRVTDDGEKMNIAG
jgi:transmembrane sensor